MTLSLTTDPAFAFLAPALDRQGMASRLETMLGQPLTVDTIRLLRHKPGRRCLIAYDIIFRDGTPPITLLGKARSRGIDHASYYLQQQLWQTGFNDLSPDGISVPQPLGLMPDLHLWFQRWVPGVVATVSLTQANALTQCAPIAEAIAKLHNAGIPARKHHHLSDELDILHKRVPRVLVDYPQWQGRIERLLANCTALAATLPTVPPTGIHRDFYPDQVLVSGQRLYLLDFDLYCMGDPALDIGNFVAHLTEQSLRTQGIADGFAHLETALVEHLCTLNGTATPKAIAIYKTLTLVRHIYISHHIPNRRALTPHILDLCEERLATSL